ncbi:DUF6702 family protein [Winogradskyella sediminis]|uniref:Peptidase E n=1 Tax=Winogradskyella sediminis TaxID=1382466 RepID=A0A1H1PJK0_9FLAO|nr:DUF6702 family protein [Winogradskyella sediminis]SDS11472.1 hypothetical protein SAMN04489797_0899 [Winogradskyella sediminis]
MKFKAILFVLLSLPFLISNTNNHEYYVSVTVVEYAKKEQSLQIISQIFIDDFETLIRKRFDESITLAIDDESEMVDTYMTKYLKDKLKILVNGKTVNFTFIGKEYKDDIAYCYLEVENVSKLESIEITNQILFDVFSGQQNIVRLKVYEKNKSFLLVPDNDVCLLNFN